MSFYKPLRHEGYLFVATNDGDHEFRTITCAHCCKVMVIKHMQLAENITYGGYCRGCDRHICAECYGKQNCKPIEKWCEEQEASYHARRSYANCL